MLSHDSIWCTLSGEFSPGRSENLSCEMIVLCESMAYLGVWVTSSNAPTRSYKHMLGQVLCDPDVPDTPHYGRNPKKFTESQPMSSIASRAAK